MQPLSPRKNRGSRLTTSCSLTLSSQNPNKLSTVSLCYKGSLLTLYTHTVNILKVNSEPSAGVGPKQEAESLWLHGFLS